MEEEDQVLVARIHACCTPTEIKHLEDAVREHVDKCDRDRADEIIRIFNERKDRLVKGTRIFTGTSKNHQVYDLESVPWEDDMELVRAVVVDPSKRKFSREKAQNNATQNQDNNTSDIGESQFSLNLEDSVLESSSLPQDVWKNLFYRNDYMEILRNKALIGVLATSPFRSVCWRIFVGSLPENTALWIQAAHDLRKQYDVIRSEYFFDPWSADQGDPLVNNPLSESKESLWYKYFKGKELRDVIVQDVVRTFPEVDYFHCPRVYNLLTEILFCYSSLNADIGYRQGMHELLAPILMLIDKDSLALQEEANLPDEIRIILDSQFVAHDAYAAFSSLMEKMKPFFEVEQHAPSRSSKASKNNSQNERRLQRQSTEEWIKFKNKGVLHPTGYQCCNRTEADNSKQHEWPKASESVLQQQLNRLHYDLLKSHDPVLHDRFNELQIPPQMFGIRWIRLLFSREFTFEATLTVWDALFADFELLDFLCLAMLMYIRDFVLEHGYVESLSLLMKFPSIKNVQFLIQKALHLRNPRHYPDPSGWSYVPVQEPECADSSYFQSYLTSAGEWTRGLVDTYIPQWMIQQHANPAPQLKNMRFAETVQDFRKMELQQVQEALIRLGEEMLFALECMDVNASSGSINDRDEMLLVNMQLRKVCFTLLGHLPLEVCNYPRVCNEEEASALPDELQSAKAKFSLNDSSIPEDSKSVKEVTRTSKNNVNKANKQRSQHSSRSSNKSRGIFSFGRPKPTVFEKEVDYCSIQYGDEISFEPLEDIILHRKLVRENMCRDYSLFRADPIAAQCGEILAERSYPYLAFARFPSQFTAVLNIPPDRSTNASEFCADGDEFDRDIIDGSLVGENSQIVDHDKPKFEDNDSSFPESTQHLYVEKSNESATSSGEANQRTSSNLSSSQHLSVVQPSVSDMENPRQDILHFDNQEKMLLQEIKAVTNSPKIYPEVIISNNKCDKDGNDDGDENNENDENDNRNSSNEDNDEETIIVNHLDSDFHDNDDNVIIDHELQQPPGNEMAGHHIDFHELNLAKEIDIDKEEDISRESNDYNNSS